MRKKAQGPFPAAGFTESPMLHIGRRLKEARLAAGLSLNEVGKTTGMDRSSISRYEDGVIPISLDRLQTLADALHVTILWFFADGVVPPDWLARVGDEHKLGILNWVKAYINPKVPDSARDAVRDMLTAFGCLLLMIAPAWGDQMRMCAFDDEGRLLTPLPCSSMMPALTHNDVLVVGGVPMLPPPFSRCQVFSYGPTQDGYLRVCVNVETCSPIKAARGLDGQYLDNAFDCKKQ